MAVTASEMPPDHSTLTAIGNGLGGRGRGSRSHARIATDRVFRELVLE
jgi:hypothetical protein